MESNGCFVYANEFVGVCVESCEYHGFYIKSGMIVIDKDLAREAFGIPCIEDDAIVSYENTDDCSFGIWAKLDSHYKKGERCIAPHLNELAANLEEIIAACGRKDIDRLICDRPSDSYAYTGEGFRVTCEEPGDKCNDGGEYGYYMDFRKTEIPGLYDVESWTTCDFDSCGTGFEGFAWLTERSAKLWKSSGIYSEDLKKHSKRSVAVRVVKEILEREEKGNE
nr:MAG TPA: hypothetical protein [Caudoviricetes sp.]